MRSVEAIPVALPLHHKLIGVVGDAVQGGVRQNGIIKECLPFIHMAIAGNDCRGSRMPLYHDLVEVVRFLARELLKPQIVDDQEIREALEDVVSSIIGAIRIALEKTPPELSADIIDRGIVLTGGGALLKNFDKRIREETQLPVFITEDPLATVVLGAGKMLDDLPLLKKISLI